MRSIRSIHPSTLGKLLREHFTGDIPPTYSYDEQKTLIAEIKAQLEKTKSIHVDSYYHYPRDKGLEERALQFSLEDRSYYYRHFCSLTLKFDENYHLVIEQRPHRATVYQVAQIESFIDKLRAEYERKKAQAHKTDKINNLKQQAIVARVKEIAKEDRFHFATTWRDYQNKLKIMVRLEGGLVMEVDIPYNNFQEVLKNIRPLIRNVNELQKLGISFKIKSSGGYSGRGWITPDGEGEGETYTADVDDEEEEEEEEEEEDEETEDSAEKNS